MILNQYWIALSVTHLIRSPCYPQVLFSLFVGIRSLGYAIGNMEALVTAKSAAKAVFDLIDLVSSEMS